VGLQRNKAMEVIDGWKHYSIVEMMKAQANYKEITGEDYDKFWEWLGFRFLESSGKLHWDVVPPLRIGLEVTPDKMALLLSPHYRTLFKIYEIKRQEQDHGW
jgi:hypothetical protein